MRALRRFLLLAQDHSGTAATEHELSAPPFVEPNDLLSLSRQQRFRHEAVSRLAVPLSALDMYVFLFFLRSARRTRG